MKAALLLICALGTTPFAATSPSGLRLTGLEAEQFLLTAEVVERIRIPIGVSKPQRVVLTDTTLTLSAIWKTIDRFEQFTRFDRGKPQMSFRDSYKNEIAAYELAKLLGLAMVPPTVERHINGESGSLQLWVEHAMTEKERQDLNLRSNNLEQWNNQMHTVRLFHQLISDSDFNNIRNILSDTNFHIYIIDSSRSFRIETKLRKETSLLRFSRKVLGCLESLDQSILEAHLGQWLSPYRIRSLLKRRDRILDRARFLVAELGEAVVLFD